MQPANLPQLTKRENEILKIVALGKRNKEIAECLRISVTTTQNHLRHLYKKLGVRNRTEATEKYWIKQIEHLTGK
jgi:DNA-binding CsgD family transcriptional regulator